MPMLAAAVPAISAAAGAAGGYAQLKKGQEVTPMDSSIRSRGGVNFDAPQSAPVGASLPTQPLQANLGGGNLPGNVSGGSYALPRNNGLYQGAQNLDLLSALQGGK